MTKKWDDDTFSSDDVFGKEPADAGGGRKKEIFIDGRRYVLDESRPDMSRVPEPEALRWLNSPPRQVSPGAAMRLMMSGPAIFGWIFATFGMIFVCVFIGSMHRADRSKDWRDAEKATLVSSEKAGMEINDSPVYKHVFEKSNGDGESPFRATCYSFRGMENRVGQPVDVEHCAAHGLYRIKGTTVGMMDGSGGGMIVYIVFIFPLIGMSIVLYCLYSGLRTAWLLRNGEATKGMVQNIQSTGTRINDQPVMKITYEFTANDGEKHTATHRTTETEAVTDDPYEVLFYDPRNPKRIYLLDALPKAVELEEGDGSFRLSRGAGFSTFLITVVYLAFLGIFIFECGIFMGWWTLAGIFG